MCPSEENYAEGGEFEGAEGEEDVGGGWSVPKAELAPEVIADVTRRRSAKNRCFGCHDATYIPSPRVNARGRARQTRARQTDLSCSTPAASL